MEETKIKEKNKTCLRCGHKWIAQIDNPVCCPRCKSPAWNKPRVREKKESIWNGK